MFDLIFLLGQVVCLLALAAGAVLAIMATRRVRKVFPVSQDGGIGQSLIGKRSIL